MAIANRRARHEYFILDSYECGIVLVGSEVKSIRDGRANLADAYARIESGEVWLLRHARLALPLRPHRPRPHPPAQAAAPPGGDRPSGGKLTEAGLTLVPLKVYFKDGLAKIELAVARGKRQWDKRQAMAERDAKRETDRVLKDRSRSDH